MHQNINRSQLTADFRYHSLDLHLIREITKYAAGLSLKGAGNVGGSLSQRRAFAVFRRTILTHPVNPHAAAQPSQMLSKTSTQSTPGAGHQRHFSRQHSLRHNTTFTKENTAQKHSPNDCQAGSESNQRSNLGVYLRISRAGTSADDLSITSQKP
jgi:hypothetical protein